MAASRLAPPNATAAATSARQPPLLPPHPLSCSSLQGYREDDGLYLESDTDEQLLIHIPFNTACKLSGLVLKSVKSAEQAPKRVKLFVNQPTIGFSEAADTAGVQVRQGLG